MQLLRNMIEKVYARRCRRAAVRQLREMSPRLLRDIGIGPHQIDAAVDGILQSRYAPDDPALDASRERKPPVKATRRLACC